MSFSLDVDPALRALALRVREFIDDEVIPFETELRADAHGIPDAVRTTLRSRAAQAGLLSPTAPLEFGGLGLDHRAQALVLEESGRSLLGPAAMNCAAPDEGNILLLERVASPSQKATYLAPLSAGRTRSCFAMTEPSPGAGADPNALKTTATPHGDQWRIDGEKWFITGADGASFAIVMARTDEGATMFLVDADNPGMVVERILDTLDTSFQGGHCVVRFKECIVPSEAILGTVHQGFKHAQVRLAPARLTHCMRWLGAARRAHEHAVGYARQRPMFGSRLSDLGMAQQMIAENEIDIAASRGLIWQAAWQLDQGRSGRRETSIAKAFVGEAVCRIVDRSVQLCGASGTISDYPVQAIFRETRPFRIYDGPTETHRWALSRRVVRQSEAGMLPGDWLAT